jgi:hypothetical protein
MKIRAREFDSEGSLAVEVIKNGRFKREPEIKSGACLHFIISFRNEQNGKLSFRLQTIVLQAFCPQWLRCGGI